MYLFLFCSLKSGWTGKKGKQRVSRLLANANETVGEARLHNDSPLLVQHPFFFFFLNTGVITHAEIAHLCLSYNYCTTLLSVVTFLPSFTSVVLFHNKTNIQKKPHL